MIDKLIIRPEKVEDISRIDQIIKAAFEQISHSNQKEHLLVADLRKHDALTLSLVAKRDHELLGHIAFSEVTINDEFTSWYGLAPVSVDPEYQHRGIGSKLIEHGLKELKNLGAGGCVLVGEPDYYRRFGFRHQNNLAYEGIPEEYFLVQSFSEEIPSGQIKYHPLFNKVG